MITKRQKRIIELLKTTSDFQKVATLANIIGVSERTLHSEIKSLELKGIKIIKKRGSGIKISHQSEDADASKLDISNTVDRRINIMQRLIFNGEKVTYLGLAEEYFTSTSSIQKDIRFIEKILFEDSQLKFTSDQYGTRLVVFDTQSSIKIMLNFIDFVLNEFESESDYEMRIDILKEFYSADVVEVCKSILYSFVKKYVNEISEIYVENFLKHLIALIYHLTNNQHIKMSGKVIDHYEHAFYIDSAVKILHKASLRLNFNYENDDVKYLSLLLLNYRFEQVPSNSIDDNITLSIVEKVSDATNIEFTKDLELIEQLKRHIPAMISRLKNHTIVKNPFTEQIKIEYSITYKTVWMATEEILQDYGVQINSDEVAFLTLYFQLSIEKNGVGRKILVICPTGIVTSELLISRIKKMSPSLDNIEVASIYELEEIDLKEFDVILSTVKLEGNGNNIHYISPLISNENLIELLKLNESTELTPKREVSLEKYIPEDLIFTNFKVSSKEELLEQICNYLLEKDLVINSFKTNLLKREKLGSTDLPIGVAIPHGKASDVKKSFVSVVQLDKKLNWEEYKVKLVFIIGISPNDIMKTRKIISSVYEVFNNEELLKSIKYANNKKEVVKNLYGWK